MNMSNKEIAQKVLIKVGGSENVKDVYHCATRLRFTLNSSKSTDIDAIKQIEGVIDVLGEGTQIQVVIGSPVNKVYKELSAMLTDEIDENRSDLLKKENY